MNIINDNVIANVVRAVSEGNPRRVGMMASKDPLDRNVAEFAFAPNQVINVGIGGNRGALRNSCLGGLSFRAGAGQQYEVELTGSDVRCWLKVSTLESDATGVTRRPVQDLQPLVCKSARQ
ncbi:hypothetical protein ACN22W_10560 [Burkholderia theae]|uniref:hypothetical protein n=1 Tax=Burkholderia theae TaxID=3143496 RepID=UPI003AFAF8F0